MDTDAIIEEVNAILGRTAPATSIEMKAPLPTIREGLQQAAEGLRAAETTFEMLYENRAVPPGIAGTDAIKARDLAREVDRLLASVDNYYLEAAIDGPDHPTKPG